MMKVYILIVLLLLTSCSLIEQPEEIADEEEVTEVTDEETIEEEPEKLIIEPIQKINDTPIPEPEPEPEPELEEPEEPEYEGKSYEVIIKDLTLQPSILEINVGDTVIWKIEDKVSVKLYGSAIKPPVLYYGDEYVLKFERPGIFPYADEYHGGIFGEIRVKEMPLTLEEQVEEPDGIHFVNIKEYSFLPKYLTVKKGEIVIWEAFDPSGVSVDGAGFHSGPMRKEDKFYYQFNQTGTFPYGSTVRPNMIGEVIVE